MLMPNALIFSPSHSLRLLLHIPYPPLPAVGLFAPRDQAFGEAIYSAIFERIHQNQNSTRSAQEGEEHGD